MRWSALSPLPLLLVLVLVVSLPIVPALFFGPPASRRPRPTTRPDPQGTLLTDYIRGLFNQRQPANQRQPIRGNQRQGPSKSSESVVLARTAGLKQRSSIGTQT